MYAILQKRADGMQDQSVECEKVTVVAHDPGSDETTTITVEFTADSGDNGEFRVIVDEECVWSALLVDPVS